MSKDSKRNLDLSFLASAVFCSVAFANSDLCLASDIQTLTNVPQITHADLPLKFTTKAYRREALRMVIREANKVAHELQLPETLPITETNLTEVYISPYGFARGAKAIGNITTKSYGYCVSRGNKFCYLVPTREEADCQRWQREYTWPKARMDTNAAFQIATQWLTAVSMDVPALMRDLHLIIEPSRDYIIPHRSTFVPVYNVQWCKKWKPIPGVIFSDPPEWDPVASVRLFLPTKTLVCLRVEDPKYILRESLVFTNLEALLASP